MKDFDLTKLPDDQLPEITELPGQLQGVALVIGVRPTMLLAREFRATHTYWYSLDSLERKLRDNWIRAEYDRMLKAGEKRKVKRLALETGISERQVWNVLGRLEEEEKDQSQQLLFG